MTDEQAIRLSQNGDRDAFRHLVERYKDTLYGTAFLMTGDRTAAEDHVQEAFLSAWRGIRRFQRGRPFKPWVVRVLVNAVVSHRRRRSPSTAPLEEAEQTKDPSDVVESMMAGTRHETVRGALSRLSPEHRQVVVLRYFADMTVPEVAQSVGVREGTVKSRLHRALGRLREELEKSCERRGGDGQ